MKKTLTVIGLMTALVVLTSGFYADSGKVKFCGSPGEGTCQSCHNSNAVNSSILTMFTTGQTGPGSTYTPGDIYTIVVYVNCINSNIGGFAVEILDSTGNDAGRILVTDTQSTELKIAYVGNTKRTTIVHKSGYIPSSLYFGAIAYEFKWVVPNSDVGNVSLYTSVVSANGDGTPANDFTCTMSLNFTYNPPIINSISEVQSVTDAPQYKFYDLQGKQVANSYSELSLLPKAIYIADSSGVRKKIMN